MIGIDTDSGIIDRAGVQSSLGSTGPARGIQSSSETSVKKVDPGPSYILEISGAVTVTTGIGAGGETSTTFQTPEPTTPLKRIDLNA